MMTGLSASGHFHCLAVMALMDADSSPWMTCYLVVQAVIWSYHSECGLIILDDLTTLAVAVLVLSYHPDCGFILLDVLTSLAVAVLVLVTIRKWTHHL